VTGPEYKTSRCSTCSAQVIWARTVHGIPMMVDAQPTERGDLALQPRQSGTPQVWKPTPEQRAGRALYRSHFATCPDADAHRRKGRR
jgi:hypothetical protein